MAEQLICNQQVVGSTPITSSKETAAIAAVFIMGEFPSGQRGQTVNLLAVLSVVQIHLPPPCKKALLSGRQKCVFCWWEMVDSDHRSETQQIYSLPPLATREISHMKSTVWTLELVNGVEPSTC